MPIEATKGEPSCCPWCGRDVKFKEGGALLRYTCELDVDETEEELKERGSIRPPGGHTFYIDA